MMSRRQEKITHNTLKPPTYVGIDVGKTMLDVFIHPHGCVMRIGNNDKAISKLAAELEEYDVQCIAMEAGAECALHVRC